MRKISIIKTFVFIFAMLSALSFYGNTATAAGTGFSLPKEQPLPPGEKRPASESRIRTGEKWTPKKTSLDAKYIFPDDKKLLGDKSIFTPENNADARMTKFMIFAGAVKKDDRYFKRAEEGLDKLAADSDREWGGFFDGGGNFGKSLGRNAEAMDAFLQHLLMSGKKEDRAVVEKIARYVKDFLSDKNGFFEGQAADLMSGGKVVSGKDFYKLTDAERGKRGMPQIYRDVPVRENLEIAEVFLRAGQTLGRPEFENAALNLLGKPESLGFDSKKGMPRMKGGGYGGLEDNTALMSAYIAAYETTGETPWLDKAKKQAELINTRWKDAKGGGWFDYTSDATEYKKGGRGYKSLEGNTVTAAAFDHLFALTDKKDYHDSAGAALELFAPSKKNTKWRGPEFTMAAYKHLNHPLKIAIVGSKNDPVTKALRIQANQFFEPNKVVLTLDPKTDAGRLAEMPYGARPKPTLYACVETACSMPASDPAKVKDHLRRFVDRYVYKKSGLEMNKLQ